MDLIITILPVVTKDLPISPRFTPYNFFYRDASSALLQLVNQWSQYILPSVQLGTVHPTHILHTSSVFGKIGNDLY